jgi:hypothetical protein
MRSSFTIFPPACFAYRSRASSWTSKEKPSRSCSRLLTRARATNCFMGYPCLRLPVIVGARPVRPTGPWPVDGQTGSSSRLSAQLVDLLVRRSRTPGNSTSRVPGRRSMLERPPVGLFLYNAARQASRWSRVQQDGKPMASWQRRERSSKRDQKDDCESRAFFYMYFFAALTARK